jgi:2-polyprenyl-6-methoxyphenol hydroxylase-like FAD-dependent oxidoreductase
MGTSNRTTVRPTQAVVIGGSIAGLLAARVLFDHFDTVSVFERDRMPSAPSPRSGAPQAAHQHVLLLRGLQIVEALFPGFRDELAALGAPIVDMAAEMAWLTAAGWGVRFESDLKMLTCSRDLLEWALRRRLLALGSIRFVEAADVCGLAGDGHGIVGVRVRHRGLSADNQDECARLVVDASGRRSKLPEWLAALGYDRPQERVVNGYLGYASRIYRTPAAPRQTWRGAYVQPAPPAHKRGGVIFPLEGNRWQVTLAGMGGDYPPTDEAGFLGFAESLRSPILFDAIRDAEPLTPVAGFRSTENRCRRYETLRRWPEGLIVLGDAACAFNPVYAQGMTTAALGAQTLSALLARRGTRDSLAGLGRQFQRELARVNAAPWQLATSEDLRLPQTTGAKVSMGTRLAHAYFDRVIQLTTERQDVRLAFLRTMHMLDGPGVLFAPRIVVAALRARPAPAGRASWHRLSESSASRAGAAPAASNVNAAPSSVNPPRSSSGRLQSHSHPGD